VNDPKERDPLNHADQGSTNLFVGNVAPDIDESMLLREFGRFGPIGSVKIMWPRDEEQRLRGKNTGFVAFMHRKDAEKAKSVLDGALLHDMELAVGWGKSVPLPSVPIWPPATGLGQAIAAEIAPESTRERIHDGPPPKEEITGIGPDVVVLTPQDERMRFIIDALAYYVVQDGFAFEQLVMENECDNPEFKFLYDNSSPDHIYYRWRIFSLANGDTLKSWRVDPFLMFSRSARWIPPPMTGIVAAKATEAKQVKFGKGNVPLSEAARRRLEIMLDTLSSERRTIADAMVFTIDHAESCQEVSNILVQPLLSGQIPIQAIVARLYLLSDILHNTSAPVRNASQFRSTLQDAMPDIFEVLNTCYRSAPSRISQESLRRNILRVLRVWRGWYIFSDDFLNGLQAAFLRGGGINPSGELDTKDELIARIDPEYKEKLEKMKPEELDNYCKQQGVSRSGGTQKKILRLLEVHDYLKGM
jgi:U2-associated protein SR140